MQKEKKEKKENRIIESSFLILCLLDLICNEIYDTLYNELINVIKNPNDNGEILIEYISNYVEKGGITNYTFEKRKNSYNMVLFLSLLNTLLNNKNDEDDKLLLHIKKTIKITFLKIYQKSKKNISGGKKKENNSDNDSNYDSNYDYVEILNIDYDKKYIGNKNKNISSDIFSRIIPIGIVYFDDIDKMIEMCIKITNLTHNNLITKLSSIAICYFAVLAIKKVPIEEWYSNMMDFISSNKIKQYIDFNDNDNNNIMEYSIFMKYLMTYKETRFSEKKIKKSKSDSNLIYRVKFYNNYSYITNKSDYPIIGFDCISCLIIIYDTLLCCDGNFDKLIYYGVLIPGKILSIGVVLGFLYGIVYGIKNVPQNLLNHTKDLLNDEKIINMIEKINDFI
jgi:ADP-ribosylglycohydrolase